MKIRSMFLTFMFSLFAFVGVAAASQLFPLTTPFASGSISATFPTPDTSAGVETQNFSDTTNTTDHTSYTGHAFSVATKAGKASFAASYFDYAATRGSDVATLDAAIDGSLIGMKLVLVPNSRENTSFAGLYAREAEGVDANFDGFVVISTVGTRAYIAVVVFDKSLHATEADANDFFASVRPR
jgi:hypothetical protein